MPNRDDWNDIPPIVPDQDHLETHHNDRKGTKQEIVRGRKRGSRQTGAGSRVAGFTLVLLTLAAIAGAVLAYHFYHEIYEANLHGTQLRLNDLEQQLALTDEGAADEARRIMSEVELAQEQYDLLWANWRTNNQTVEDIRSEIARLELANQGQDEIAANNSQAISRLDEALRAELGQVTRDLAELTAAMAEMGSLRHDIESIREIVTSGDDTVLGLAGRIEDLENDLESIDAYRQQTNEILLRLQESIRELQRTANTPPSE